MLVLQSDIEENIKRENSCDKKFDTPDRAVRCTRKTRYLRNRRNREEGNKKCNATLTALPRARKWRKVTAVVDNNKGGRDSKREDV